MSEAPSPDASLPPLPGFDISLSTVAAIARITSRRDDQSPGTSAFACSVNVGTVITYFPPVPVMESFLSCRAFAMTDTRAIFAGSPFGLRSGRFVEAIVSAYGWKPFA